MPHTDPTPATRRLVRARADGRCEYCRCWEECHSDSFEVEHVTPRSKGGTSEPDNLAWSCRGCNSNKSAHTVAFDPLTGADVPLYNPRTQAWGDHFAWSEDTTQLVGLTPVGRAAIALLLLNRTGLVNLRRAMRKDGAHPPP